MNQIPKPFRVLFVSLHFARLGGLEIYNLDVAKSLTRQGGEVTAISMFTSETGLCEGIPTRGLLPILTLLRPLRLLSWPRVLALYLLSLRPQYDLVIAGHLFVLPQVAAFARRRGIPYWVGVYGIEVWADWAEPVRQALWGCDRIIAVSHYTADSVRSRLDERADRVEIVHSMVDVDLFAPRSSPIPNSAPCVLTVSRLSAAEKYKGHDIVMAVLPRVTREVGKPVHYWIVGDGDDRPRLEELAVHLGVSDLVKFFGRVPIEDLINIYNTCDVFVMPSRVERRADGTWAGEGFGIVYIEAAACGKPVIAANQGGATDAVQHGVTGLLVNPTQDDVADALCRILADEQMRRQMGEAGRQFVVNNFSQAVFDRRWAELVASLGY